MDAFTKLWPFTAKPNSDRGRRGRCAAQREERETYVCPNGPRQALRLHLRRRDHRQRCKEDRRRPGDGAGPDLLAEEVSAHAPSGHAAGEEMPDRKTVVLGNGVKDRVSTG